MTPTPSRSPAKRTDAGTGLEYLRARYYDAATGAFISRDRYPGATVRPLTQDRFSYALGNPILNTDPSGMCVADSVYEKIEHLRNPFRGGTPGYDTFEKIREMSLAAITKFCGNLEALKNAAKKFPDMAKHFANDLGSAGRNIGQIGAKSFANTVSNVTGIVPSCGICAAVGGAFVDGLTCGVYGGVVGGFVGAAVGGHAVEGAAIGATVGFVGCFVYSLEGGHVPPLQPLAVH